MIIIIILLILFIYSLFEYRNIQIKKISSDDFGLKETKNLKLVYLSDIQYDLYGHFTQKRLMQKIVETINNLNPDLIIIGGDIIHHRHSDVFDYLKELNSPIIAILGNHDYKDIDKVIESYHDLNIKVLINETYQFKGITFIGLDDLRHGAPKLPEYNKEDYNILLIHEPDDFESYAYDHQFNISLAGHLHGGQITFFGKYAPILPTNYKQKYRYGFIKINNNTLYVSSGLGGFVFFLPLRFFAKPEIIVLDI